MEGPLGRIGTYANAKFAAAGTPGYAAPECPLGPAASSNPIDGDAPFTTFASDVWSVGMVLFQLLMCGRRQALEPFLRLSLDSVALSAAIECATALVADQSCWGMEQVCSLIRSMTSMDPKERPSAEAALARLVVVKNLM